MARAKTYIIPFAGLSQGQHEFNFEAGNSFFKEREYSEVKKAAVDVLLKLNKQSTMLILHFGIKGTVNLPCDRCAEPFDLPVEGEAQLIVKFGETFAEEQEAITIPFSESELDIEQYLYEFINLVIPQKRVHEKIKECNKEVINKLKKLEGSGKEADTRWAKLKNIDLKKQ